VDIQQELSKYKINPDPLKDQFFLTDEEIAKKIVGFALPDANIHAPNEHFNLSNYFKGIKAMTQFYETLDKIKEG